MKSKRLYSIDEPINYLRLHKKDKIKDMATVSTKTFYNYIHEGKALIKPIDPSRMLKSTVQKKNVRRSIREAHIILVIGHQMKTIMDL